MTKQSREQVDRYIALMERQTAEGPTKHAVHELVRDGQLSQLLVYLAEGGQLSDHPKPPAAALQVMRGTITVAWTGEDGVAQQEEVATGDLFVLPNAVHNVSPLGGAACFLLTRIVA